MRIDSPMPFETYHCYLNHHKKMDRMQVCLYDPITRKRRTILYSKFLMSCKLGRILTPDEEVDHIDHDKTNDDINNLQILTKEENREKQSLTYNKAMVDKICGYCGITFQKEKRNTYTPRKNFFCCRQCLYDSQRKSLKN